MIKKLFILGLMFFVLFSFLLVENVSAELPKCESFSGSYHFLIKDNARINLFCCNNVDSGIPTNISPWFTGGGH